jgi:hypothetical protein
LKIHDLRDERRLLGAASVGPIDMGTQAMSVARVGPPHSARIGTPPICGGHIDQRNFALPKRAPELLAAPRPKDGEIIADKRRSAHSTRGRNARYAWRWGGSVWPAKA